MAVRLVQHGLRGPLGRLAVARPNQIWYIDLIRRLIQPTGLKDVESWRWSFFERPPERSPLGIFLRTLPKPDRLVVGDDLKTVQFGFPICRPLGGGLHEVRSSVPSGREVRCFFAIAHGRILMLHAIIKTSQRTPVRDLTLVRRRMP